jgi:hypothetical protein
MGRKVNRQTWRLFGIPVLTVEVEVDDEQLYIRNTAGHFELAEVENDEDDWEYEEDSGFGFRS